MRDAGHRTPDIGRRTAKKAKIIYPPPRGVDIMKTFKSVICHRACQNFYMLEVHISIILVFVHANFKELT